MNKISLLSAIITTMTLISCSPDRLNPLDPEAENYIGGFLTNIPSTVSLKILTSFPEKNTNQRKELSFVYIVTTNETPSPVNIDVSIKWYYSSTYFLAGYLYPSPLTATTSKLPVSFDSSGSKDVSVFIYETMDSPVVVSSSKAHIEVIPSSGWKKILQFKDLNLTGINYINSENLIITSSSGNGIVNTSSASSRVNVYFYGLPNSTGIDKLSMTADKIGFGLKSTGNVYRTVDNSSNWTLVFSTTQQLNDVSSYETSSAGVCGSRGFISLSFDGGNTWNSTNVSSSDLNGISFPSQSKVIAVGTGGTIISSTDCGTNWFSITSPTSQDLFDIAFANSNGIIVGENGTILASTNLGETWFSVSSPTTDRLNVVKSYSESTFIAGGRNGVFLKSRELTNFQSINLPVSQSIVDVSAVLESKFGAVLSSGEVYEYEVE